MIPVEPIPTDENLTVAVIDDDEYTIQLLNIMLNDEYNVLSSETASSGLNLVQEHDIDLILLDWMMPRIDGLSLLNTLKQNETTRDIPVIFISGVAERDSFERAMSYGAADYIRKPFRKEEILRKVSSVLSAQIE